MLRPLLLVALGLFGLTRLLAQPDSRLARLLTPEEFARAGLQKLTPEELAALETALASHQQLPATPVAAASNNSSNSGMAGPDVMRPASPAGSGAPLAPATTMTASGAPTDARTAAFGAEQVLSSKPKAAKDKEATPDELHSRIEGTVQEFSGRAVFVLENGQIWQQRIPESVFLSKKYVNPEVIIQHGTGGYKMIIVPANRVVFVKRIQ